MKIRLRIGLLLLLWAAAFLRFPALFQNHFHADEALFASWARLIAVWRDPLLLTQAVDKPPLLFYLQALFYPLQGPVEWGARLPNFIVSLLLVPATAVTTYRLSRHEIAALLSAAFITFMPLTLQYSATAFTDPLLTFWLLGAFALLTGRHRHFGWSGFLFGLALATKYQALLFLPLLGGWLWLTSASRREWTRWGGGVLPALLALLVWEISRTGGFTLWSAQVSNFGGVRLAWSWELWSRLAAWWHVWETAVPSWSLPLLLLLSGWLASRAWRRARRTEQLLGLFVVSYLLLHWLLAVPVWDRYLLPLFPFMVILWAVGVGDWARFAASSHPIISTYLSPALLTLFCLLCLPTALAARDGRFPLGGQPTADEGAHAIAVALTDAPYGTVLYDHWYSWQWRYHLFDKRVYVSWFPHADALVENLTAFGHDGSPRYLALPDTAVALPIQRAVRAAGFQLQPVAHADKIQLYQIIPAQVDDATG